jgi:hypothetical protein
MRRFCRVLRDAAGNGEPAGSDPGELRDAVWDSGVMGHLAVRQPNPPQGIEQAAMAEQTCRARGSVHTIRPTRYNAHSV